MAITAFLSRSPGLLNRRPGGPASLGHGPHSSIFSPTDLNFLSPGLYNNLTPTYFLRASQFRTQFNPSTVKVAPDILISSTGCTCYLHRCISSLTAWRRSIYNSEIISVYQPIINENKIFISITSPLYCSVTSLSFSVRAIYSNLRWLHSYKAYPNLAVS